MLRTTDPSYSDERSRQEIPGEINGLESSGVFELVRQTDLTLEAIILGMIIVLGIKDGGTAEECYNERIVALGNHNKQKAWFIHIAVAVGMRSVRLHLTIALPLR